jgi:uncharacterized protein (TIGR04255 family)
LSGRLALPRIDAHTGDVSPYPHLERAPIQEALIDLRATLADHLDVAKLREQGSPEPGFPSVRDAKKLEARLELGQQAVESRVTGRGVFFRSEDNQRVAQFRDDGYTFNWLRPYSTWEEFAGQAHRFWEHYVAVARPQEITRVAVRYINRFPVVLPVQLEEVFSVSLQLPPGIAGFVEEFLYRTTFREALSHQSCNMTLTGERRPSEGADIIFDIDCFELRNFRAEDPVVWSDVLPMLRELKNRVFFSGLRDTVIERFK